MTGSVGAEASSEAGSESTPAADVIVVAAGASRRMGGLDKLTVDVAGRPLLAWTLEALGHAKATERIVIVTTPDRIERVTGAAWLPDCVFAVVPGGERRQDSVVAGLRALDEADGDEERTDDRVLLVHDGARPLLSPDLVDRVARAVAEDGAAIPIWDVADTLKHVDGRRVLGTLDRHGVAAAQTPQGARRGLFRAAFAELAKDSAREVTDEASVLEAAGIPVRAVHGEAINFKVTTPPDVILAEEVLRARAERGEARVIHDRGGARTGFGIDRHAFGPGASLRLGGVEIPGAPRLHGHSDGDVVLHAIVNAMLGGAGEGDIGRLYPADRRTPRGIDSGEMVREAMRVVREAGWTPAAATVAIEAARPRLGAHLDAMTSAIAELLSIEPSAVGVTASTGNLSSSEGAGRSISATALVTLIALEPR